MLAIAAGGVVGGGVVDGGVAVAGVVGVTAGGAAATAGGVLGLASDGTSAAFDRLNWPAVWLMPPTQPLSVIDCAAFDAELIGAVGCGVGGLGG